MPLEWSSGVVDGESVDGPTPPTTDEWTPVPTDDRDDDAPVAHRTRFEDPRSDSRERTFLELRGACGKARAWANGDVLGTVAPSAAPALFEFEPRRENEVVVVPEPPEANGSFANPGAGWDATVETKPATFVRRLDASPRLVGDGAAIDVEIEIDAAEPIDDAVTLSLRPEGFRGAASMARARVEADAGERTVVSETLEVRDPALWWPRELGPQHRYAVRAKLDGDAVERRVGIRTVERDEDGLLVNGRRVRARGFALPAGGAVDDVERAVEANATIVRARGRVPGREFYAACDEAGLLVWQDLPTVRSTESESELANALSRAYANHPCVAMYGVREASVDPFEEPIGSGFLARLAVRWRAWRADFDRRGVETVAEALPEDVPVVPLVGPPGVDPDAALLYPGWRYLEAGDVDWLLDTYPSLGNVVGGFGTASLSSDDADPDRVPGIDAGVLERRATTPEESRAYQARTVKTVAEALRRRGCGVLVADALRDAASDGGTGVLAHDGTEKPAYRAIADSYEPVQTVLDGSPEAGTVGITLVNDAAERVEATIVWQAGDAGGEQRAVADPFEAADAGSIDVPPDTERIELETSVDGRTVRNRYRL